MLTLAEMIEQQLRLRWRRFIALVEDEEWWGTDDTLLNTELLNMLEASESVEKMYEYAKLRREGVSGGWARAFGARGQADTPSGS